MDGDPQTVTFRCSNCEDRGKSPVAFVVTTVPGAISEHWCGMKIRWTGVGKYGMDVIHDPGDARGLVILSLLALPTVLALIAGGTDAAALVGIGTIVVLVVWRAFLMPGIFFLSDIVDFVRRAPPDQYASRNGRWW